MMSHNTTETPSQAHYRGRFAPSPTGPLHFGSLIAAIGSYLQAKSHSGEWLVRIEDIDPPREIPGASDSILRTLDAYGFEWDGEVCYQSHRSDAYLAALEQLHHEGRTYHCDCSRKQISERGRQLGLPVGVYPGSCRGTTVSRHQRHAIRLLVPDGTIGFEDAIQGHFSQRLEREVGDFVLRRADGLFAYQLAVVVDDASQGITEVVRGSDLLDNTPRQIALQQALGLATPHYLHLPVVLNAQGQKLSKQTFAPALDEASALLSLWHGLRFLGQQPIEELLEGDLHALWKWARENWNSNRIPRKLSVPLQEGMPHHEP